MSPAVEISGLSVSYGDTAAVDCVSFALGRGEALALIGPNGAGKSTLARCAAGLERPSAGSVSVMGRDPYRTRPVELARLVSFVAQEGAADSPFTVGELMEMSRYAWRGTDRAHDGPSAVRRALDLAGASHLSDRPLRELSGGERRRAMIAAAAAQGASVAILDEPTAYLDYAAGVEAERAMIAMNIALGTSMIVITHDINSAMRVASRIIALVRGKIVWEGAPSEIAGSGGEELLESIYGTRFELLTSRSGASVCVPAAGDKSRR